MYMCVHVLILSLCVCVCVCVCVCLCVVYLYTRPWRTTVIEKMTIEVNLHC